MRAETRAFVDDWWAGTFGCASPDLWQGVQVRRHARLGDHPGVWVAWRETGLHVSTPASVGPAEADSLATQGFTAPADPDVWSTYARERGWVLVGPAVHSYLDEDPGDDEAAPRIDPSLPAGLRAVIPEEEWRESGLGDENGDTLGCFADGRLVAAAGLVDFGGEPRDIGVPVAPDRRGRGLGHRVGRAAASCAITGTGSRCGARSRRTPRRSRSAASWASRSTRTSWRCARHGDTGRAHRRVSGPGSRSARG